MLPLLLGAIAAPLVSGALGGLAGGGGQQAVGDPISKLLKTLMGEGGGLPDPVKQILSGLGVR